MFSSVLSPIGSSGRHGGLSRGKPVQFSPFTDWGRRGDVKDDSAEIVFQSSFLQKIIAAGLAWAGMSTLY